MKKIIFLLLLTNVLGIPWVLGQSQKQSILLKGTVRAEVTKTPLVGATVILKRSQSKEITNTEGAFSLELKVSEDTLLVSYIGYTTKRILVSRDQILPLMITLSKSNEKLQDVIVSTGYQKIPKERATGSFTFIDEDLLDQQVTTDLTERLEAIANGVMVDRSTNSERLMVRGLSTIRGPKEPLIILNNFPYEGSLSNINPNNVESITILKDAAAASIWGTRAGNGVIVITTKKARYNRPLSIELNANVSVVGKPDFSYIDKISSSDFIDVEEFLYDKGYYNAMENSSSHPPLPPVVELLIAERDGKISKEIMNKKMNALRNHSVWDDFNKYFYQPAIKQQYALNVKGGSSDNAWLLSAGYDYNVDNLDAKYDNRLNLHFSDRFKPISNLEIKAGLFVTHTTSIGGQTAYTAIKTNGGSLPPYTRLVDGNGNALPFYKDYRKPYLDTAGNGKLLDWRYYALNDHKYLTDKLKAFDLIGDLSVKYSFFKGLSAKVNYQYERQQSNHKLLHGKNSYYTRNLVNSYTYIDPQSGIISYNIPKGAILDLSRTVLNAENLRGQLNFDRFWNDHAITAIAGAELRQIKTLGNNYRTYGYDENTLTSARVDYVQAYPLFVRGYSTFIPNINSFSDQIDRYVSFYANAAYTYKKKYTISASGRRDASNLFGVNTNDKWVPLWSAGLSWNISNEKFYRCKFLPYLKFRGTFGYSGNVDKSHTAVTTTTFLFTSPYTGSPMAIFTNYSNPDLKWEKVGMLNIGLDFRYKNNRLFGSIEYYHKKGTDLFGAAPLDYTAGLGSDVVIKNVAAMKANGWDIHLNSINVNNAFKWTSHLNLNLYNDKVTNYYLSSKEASRFVGSVPGISGIVGKPVYAMYSYKWAGLDPLTGGPQGLLNDKVSTNYSALLYESKLADLVYEGTILPKVYGSLGNTFAWNGFSLSIRLTYKTGFYFRRKGVSYADLFAGEPTVDYPDRWKKPGDEEFTNVPSMIYPNLAQRDVFYTGSEVLVDKGDYIRLQYLNLSYTFDESNIPKFPFGQCRVYLYASNLGILWRANKDHIDPEYLRGTIPPSTQFSVGLNIKF